MDEANSKYIECISQGYAYGKLLGTNKIHFKNMTNLPQGRKSTYLRVVTSYQPTKEDPYQIIWTV